MHGTAQGGGESRDACPSVPLSRQLDQALSPEWFRLHLEEQGYRPETIRTYARHARDWTAYTRRHRIDPLAPAAGDVARYINVYRACDEQRRRVLKPSPGLRRTRRQALGAYGQYLVRLGLSQGYPVSLVRVERSKPDEVAALRTLRPDEIAVVLDAARRRGVGPYTALRLLADLGPRTHELVEARRRSWSPANPIPVLRLGDEGRGSLSHREVAPSTVEAVHDYFAWLDAVMPRVDRRPVAPLLLVPVRQWDTPIPLTERRLERLVSRVVADAGIDPAGVVPRSFRCAWIRQALAAYPLAEVAAAVGHKNQTSTLRYCPSGTVPVFGEAGRVREVCGGSVVRGVLLMRALSDGGEEQPGLMELWRRKQRVAQLRTESRLLRDLEGAQAQIDALEREVADLRGRTEAVA